MAVGLVVAPLAERMDPEWPPVLIAAVVVVVSTTAISIVLMLRRLRTEVRGTRRRGGHG